MMLTMLKHDKNFQYSRKSSVCYSTFLASCSPHHFLLSKWSVVFPSSQDVKLPLQRPLYKLPETLNLWAPEYRPWQFNWKGQSLRRHSDF